MSHRSTLKLSSILTIGLFAGLTAFLLLAPRLRGNYARILIFTILLYITMALSYDVVGGMLGYLYLGHGLFFGLGAYTAAIALKHGQPLFMALLNFARGRSPEPAAVSSARSRICLSHTGALVVRRSTCEESIVVDRGLRWSFASSQCQADVDILAVPNAGIGNDYFPLVSLRFTFRYKAQCDPGK